MSAVLDERSQRRARVTAAAAHIAARQRLQRGLAPPAAGALRGSTRKRLHAEAAAREAAAARRIRPRHRRRGSIAVLVAELAALAALLMMPVFRPADVTLDGAGLLPRQTLLGAAAIPSSSLFLIDGDDIRHRLERVPFIRSVSVTTELPAGIHISVEEARPALRLRLGGRTELVADDGATVDIASIAPGAAPAVPLVMDGRRDSPLAGAATLEPSLVTLLQATAEHFPEAFGCSVAAFQWEPTGLFSIWTDRGWRAILGHLDTAEQVAAVPDQLSSLAALRAQLNFGSPAFGYVNLENPQSLAVGGSPGLPLDVLTATRAPGQPAPAAGPPAPVPATPVPAPPAPAPAAVVTPAPAPPAAAVTRPSPGPPTIIYVPQPAGQ